MRLQSFLWMGLALSVMANLFLVGVLAGPMVRGDDGPPGDPRGGLERRGPDRGGELFASLSGEERRLIRGKLRAAWRSVAAEREAVAMARRDLGEAMRAEPFDRAGVEAALERLRTGEMQLRGALEAQILDAVADMPEDRRAAIAERLLRGGEAPRERRMGPPGGE